MIFLLLKAGKGQGNMEFDLKLQQFVDWKVYNVTPIKNKFGYRVVLMYAGGTKMPQQKSGFATKKAANADRDKTLGELYSGTYVVYSNVKVKDFMLFWLEREMRPLRAIKDNYEKMVLTMDYHTVGNYDGIRVIPLLNWLMGKQVM